MKRFHIHITVEDLNASAAFYSAMFAQQPTVQKPDYAKWMIEEPRINFAISTHGAEAGVNHLGFQADSDQELQAMRVRLQQASDRIVAESGKECCYAKSDKYWVMDPSGIAWESFHSLGTVPVYGEHEVSGEARGDAPATEGRSCCAPTCCA